MKLPGGVAAFLSALLPVFLSVATTGNAAKCTPRLVRIQATGGTEQASELKYPGELASPIYVTDRNSLLYSVTLSGECSGLTQSNLVLFHGGTLSSKVNEHFAYVPLACTGSTCTGSLFPTDQHRNSLSPVAYSIKLVLAWKETSSGTSAPIGHLQWPIGTVDFSGAFLKESVRPGTPDQQEDVFEPAPEEIRGSAHRAARRQISLAFILLATILLMVPLLILLGIWTRLELVVLPIRNVMAMTGGQRALGLLFVTWCILAMATWLRLDIFILLKASALVAPPTILCLVRILRTGAGCGEAAKKKTQ